MDEYDQVQEFKARFEAMKQMASDLLGATGLSCARMFDFGDDPACLYVGKELAELNEQIAAVYERLFDLEQQLY